MLRVRACGRPGGISPWWPLYLLQVSSAYLIMYISDNQSNSRDRSTIYYWKLVFGKPLGSSLLLELTWLWKKLTTVFSKDTVLLHASPLNEASAVSEQIYTITCLLPEVKVKAKSTSRNSSDAAGRAVHHRKPKYQRLRRQELQTCRHVPG